MTRGWSRVASLCKGTLPQVTAQERTACAGGIGAFVACLFALDLLLAGGPLSHMVRIVLLSGLVLSTVAMAFVLLSDKLRMRQPAQGGDSAFSRRALGSEAYDLSYLGSRST